MDVFLIYNKIKINKYDQHNTTFTTPWGTFCLAILPFGLKNMGARYQRAMVTMFHDLIHKYIEVCVDYIFAKYQNRKDDLEDLRFIFEIMRNYNLKLNPKKFIFGVSNCKLLGYIISRRGIEMDPKMVKASMYMPYLNNIK